MPAPGHQRESADMHPFRTLGQANAAGLSALLEERLAGPDEPIVFLLHCACPRVRYTDRGKSAVALAAEPVVEIKWLEWCFKEKFLVKGDLVLMDNEASFKTEWVQDLFASKGMTNAYIISFNCS